MSMTETVAFLLNDWRNRLTDADYRTQDGLTYSFTVLETLATVDPQQPDFNETLVGLDQLQQIEETGGWDEGVPKGDEPATDLVDEIRDTIQVIETGVIPTGIA